MLTLYEHPLSAYVMKVKIALHEKSDRCRRIAAAAIPGNGCPMRQRSQEKAVPREGDPK